MPRAPSPPSTLCVLNVLLEARYGGPQKRVSVVGEALLAQGVQTASCHPFRSNVALKVATQEPKIPARQVVFEHVPRPRNLGRVLRALDSPLAERRVGLRSGVETLKRVDYVVLEASFKTMYKRDMLFMDTVRSMEQHDSRFERPVGWFSAAGSGEILQIDTYFVRNDI
jgi:hypothetical protein